MHDFFIRALLAGTGLALMSGPIGCLIIWRRMAYLGDALGHAALLGIVWSLIWQLPLMIGVMMVAVLFSLLLTYLQQKRHYGNDVLLVILAHGMLASGLIAVSKLPSIRVDIMSYLWGDVLAVSQMEVIGIYATSILLLLWISLKWRQWLFLAIHEDMAKVRGVRVIEEHWQFILMISLLIAFAIKIIGILLITALLIIPAATARRLSSTPEQMAVISSLCGMTSVISGLFASRFWDTPSGPSIVVANIVLFVLVQSAGWLKAAVFGKK